MTTRDCDDRGGTSSLMVPPRPARDAGEERQEDEVRVNPFPGSYPLQRGHLERHGRTVSSMAEAAVALHQLLDLQTSELGAREVLFQPRGARPPLQPSFVGEVLRCRPAAGAAPQTGSQQRGLTCNSIGQGSTRPHARPGSSHLTHRKFSICGGSGEVGPTIRARGDRNSGKVSEKEGVRPRGVHAAVTSDRYRRRVFAREMTSVGGGGGELQEA